MSEMFSICNDNRSNSSSYCKKYEEKNERPTSCSYCIPLHIDILQNLHIIC